MVIHRHDKSQNTYLSAHHFGIRRLELDSYCTNFASTTRTDDTTAGVGATNLAGAAVPAEEVSMTIGITDPTFSHNHKQIRMACMHRGRGLQKISEL